MVICGPKTSETVARLMARDDVVRFTKGDEYWHLTEQRTGRNYYSLLDIDGSDADLGYLSRTHRSEASPLKFVLIAGVYAEGSAIVVDHLCNYRTIKRYVKHFKREGVSI